MLKKQNGFSLVEAIVAVVLIAIAVLPITNSIINSMMLNKSNQEKFSATALAQKLTEDIQVIGAQAALSAPQSFETNSSQTITTSYNGRNYQVECVRKNVTPYDTAMFVQQGFTDNVNIRVQNSSPTPQIVFNASNYNLPADNSFSVVIANDGINSNRKVTLYNGALSSSALATNTFGSEVKSIRIQNYADGGTDIVPVTVNLYNIANNLVNVYYDSSKSITLNIRYDLQKIVLRDINGLNSATLIDTTKQHVNKYAYSLTIKDMAGKTLSSTRTVMTSIKQ